MASITLDKLKNNIAEEEVVGGLVMVTFRCPVTEKLYHSVATMREPSGPASDVSLNDKARSELAGPVRGVFAQSEVEKHYDKVSGKPLPPRGGTNFDRAARERAVVEAFEAVAASFVWDESRHAFIDAEEAKNSCSDFDRQLSDHPIETHWERLVAARMLAAVAAADGRVTPGERRFFEAVLNAETGALNELIAAGAPSSIELEETRPAARATMLMLSFALAMCDEDFDEREKKLLDKFARGLGIGLDRAEQIRHWASEKVIEAMLSACYADNKLDTDERARIEQLAHNIGVNEAVVAKVDVRVRKRQGAAQ